MELLLDWIELVVALALVLAVGVAWLARPLFDHIAGQRMQQSNFLVFEAYEVHWQYLKSDMERAGWRSTDIEPAHGEANLYRFQQCSPFAEKLGDLVNKGMPETANREEGADLLGRVDKRDSQARLLLIQDCFLRSSHGSRGFVGCGVGTDRATAAA